MNKTAVVLAMLAAGCDASGCPEYRIKVIRPDGTVHATSTVRSCLTPTATPRDGCLVVEVFGPSGNIVAPAGWAIDITPAPLYAPPPHRPQAESE